MNSQIKTLKRSLAFLKETDLFRLSQVFAYQIFKDGQKFNRQEPLENIALRPTQILLTIKGYTVTVQPLPVPDDRVLPKLTDIFKISCSCSNTFNCIHSVSASLILWSAVRGAESYSVYGANTKKIIKKFIAELSLIEKVPQQNDRSTKGIESLRDNISLEKIFICFDVNILEEKVNWESCLKTLPLPKADLKDLVKSIGDHHISPFEESANHGSRFHSQLSELPFQVQYLFSDGKLLAWHEILFHEYSNLLNEDELPVIDDYEEAKSLHNYLGFYHIHATHVVNFLNVEYLFLRLLKRLAGSPKLFFVCGLDRVKPRKMLPIKQTMFDVSEWQINFYNDDSQMSSEGRVKIGFSSSENNAISNLYLNFIFDPSVGTLTFHQHAKSFVKLAHWIEAVFPENKKTDSDLSLPQQLKQLCLTGHSRISYFYSSLDEEGIVGMRGFHGAELKGTVADYTTSKIQPSINISKDGSFYCDWNLEDFIFSNFTPAFYALGRSLNMGLADFMGVDSKLIAQKRVNLRRKRDLKVLKHYGFYAILFLETAQFLVNGKVSDDTPVNTDDEFLDWMFKRIASLLMHDEGFKPDGTPLTLMCSENVIKLIRKFVGKLRAQISEEKITKLFSQMAFIDLPNMNAWSLRILARFLYVQGRLTKGQCFLKAKTPVLDGFLPEFSEIFVKNGSQNFAGVPHQIKGFDVNLLLKTFMSLQRDGLSLSYNGKPIQWLSKDDFKTEIILDESAQKAKIDWFELHPRFFFKGQEIDSQQAHNLASQGLLEWQGHYYLLEEGELPELKALEQFWARMAGDLSQVKRKKGSLNYLRLPKSGVLDLLALRARGVEVKGGDEWKTLCDFYDNLGGSRSVINLPESLESILKPYQKSGVTWLHDLFHLKLGGVLADEMGLGKTVQTLAFFEILRHKKDLGLVLVIVPTSLTYNWMAESQKFTSDLPVRIFQSREKQEIYDFLKLHSQAVLITTYGLLVEHKNFFKDFEWNIHVYDEAQSLKNIAALRTTTAREIPAKYKICLTGTPFENHLGEFYSLVDLVVPGSLGTLEEYRKLYVNPTQIEPEDLEMLKLKIRPLILRRAKSQILKELPPKVESVVKIPMDDQQKKIYRDIALAWNEKVRLSIDKYGEAKSQIMMLTALLRLRQVCSDPAVMSDVNYTGEPPKTSLLVDSLQEITESGSSALVFTQFLATFERIKKNLAERNIPHFTIQGSSSKVMREKQLSGFMKHESGAVMLMTLKTGGMGLNLTKASYVFHIEPWWNPAVENQATDRAHRIGQDQPVQVYRYIMQDSVEEKIEALKGRKTLQFQSMFGSAEKPSELGTLSAGGLSQDDFEFLLG